MANEVFTLGAWRVKDGKETEFIEEWRALGRHFGSLGEPPGQGTLVQNVEDPHEFYSFGPWPSLDAVQAMRSHPDTPAVLGKLIALCDEGKPGTFRVVATG